MTQTYKKKLIEVALPLEAINTASAREKTIRQGHPSSLHLWWARRPIVTAKAILFAQLIDDPSSNPDKFPTEELQSKERQRLFAIISDLVKWENSNSEALSKKITKEIKSYYPDENIAIFDPFTGGGAIPHAAMAMGLNAFGSDLNPVANLISKCSVEYISKSYNQASVNPISKKIGVNAGLDGLSEDLDYYGTVLMMRCRDKIGNLFQLNEKHKHKTVLAWIWARTVESPDPSLNGAMVPLVKSFELSKKKGDRVWVEPIIDKGSCRFEVRFEKLGHTPEIHQPTIGKRGGVCIISGAAMPLSYIRSQGVTKKIGQSLLAVVLEGQNGREYVSADDFDSSILNSLPEFDNIDGEIDHWQGSTNCVVYGMSKFQDVFTQRQALTLATFSNELRLLRETIIEDANNSGNNLSPEEYATIVQAYLACSISKLADLGNSLCGWEANAQCPRHLFGRQAMPMVWDFAEANPFSNSSGGYSVILRGICNALKKISIPNANIESAIYQQNASDMKLPKSSAVVSSDPPYYDNIPYSNLSDFFYLWLQKSMSGALPELFSTIQVPKMDELVANPFRHGSKDNAETFFMNGMTEFFSELYAQHRQDTPITLYYAFKQNEIEKDGISSKGWATFIEAIIKSGFEINATWPVRTEASNRLRAAGSNALANSIVMVCRKKSENVGTITRAEFVRLLKSELPHAISALKASNISPADMPQSSIGPGIGIFSRYEAVLEADDSPMSVKTALQLINRELGAEEGDYDAETSFALTWFEQFGFNVSDYGTANNIANAKGIAVESLMHSGIAQSAGGKFRLLSRDSLEADWDPDRDKTVTIWECCQYLCRRLENRGEFEAAKLMRRMGPERRDAAKELAYALYDIAANKLNDASEATSYNSLISVWSELTVQAANMTDQDVSGDAQGRLL